MRGDQKPSRLMREEEKDARNEVLATNRTDKGATMPDVRFMNPTRKRKRADSASPSTPREGPKKRQHGEKVGCFKVGRYSAMFEQKDLDESHTLHLLVNSNGELDTEDEDVWRAQEAKTPTACLNTDRFTEATLHTAWLFLRNGKQPTMATYSIDQKWDVGERFRELSKLFPDRGQLSAAATLFDLGLAIRCPKLQRAAYDWYAEVRLNAWSPKCFANPSFCRWVVERAPEEKYRVTQYSAWLKLLKEYDPEMMRLRNAMTEATEDDSPGLATNLQELEILEPVWLYDYHLSVEASADVANPRLQEASSGEETCLPDTGDEQSDNEED
ncbi:hypothetical protein KCU81_g8295, partial [Aureobasidium melanogenum]|uniref:Uncharacterized protein n=1 Tax=Aureobasidium melanogenum (strain CBS 110374) TaxID=1043003 RepID=A0A074W098_AURM1